MGLKIFSVYDSKVEAYLPPHTLRSTGEALRVFAELSNNPEVEFCKHPGDYTLFELGEWDETTGLIALYEAKRNLGLARDFKKDVSLASVSKLAEG